MSQDFTYVGGELELFAKATRWKAYLAAQLGPFIAGDVLEVGAGLGGTTALLAPKAKFDRWVCLEPDAALAGKLTEAIQIGQVPANCEALVGSLATIEGRGFDTVLYVDVLEHIADDREELVRAAGVLRPGGRVVVLSPAHQWLFSPFDQAIGHFRRYTKSTLKALTPPGVGIERLRYLDSVGLSASLVNRLFLKQSMPTPKQIAFWDGWLVPCSRRVDWLLCYAFGKSVLAVFRNA